MQLKYLATALAFILIVIGALAYTYKFDKHHARSKKPKNVPSTTAAQSKSDTARKKEIVSID
jgi:hypothetical protein